MIAIGSDHAGFELKEIIKGYLDELGHSYKDFGTYNTDSCNYPEYALKAANAVSTGECERGILVCGTGVGISISANKVNGIRCVVCSEPYSALMSRKHNDTNMLAFGSRVVGVDLAKMIVSAWLSGEYEAGRHAKRVEMMMQIESNGKID